MIRGGDRVLLAVSAGPDSTGLALVLSELRRRLGCELIVGHVHHGLRGAAADRDQRLARRLAESLGLPFVSSSVALGSGGNLEARARDARYAALHEIAAAHDCAAIATGHTRDDQAETFLMRLLRGSGPDGLGAIQPVRADGVIRPLLDCARERVAAVVRAAGVETSDDEMNRDRRFLRTRIRSDLLPLMRELNPEIVEICARTASTSRAVSTVIEDWAAVKLGSARGSLLLAELDRVDRDQRGILLRAWVRCEAPGIALSARHIAALESISDRRNPGTVVDLPAGWRVERLGDRLSLLASRGGGSFIARRLPLSGRVELGNGWVLCSEVKETPPAALPGDLWSAVCDLEKCGELTVRRPRAGEKVRLIGLSGSKTISRILAEGRISRHERGNYPIVAAGERALWIPGIARSDASTVDGGTSRVALIRAFRVPVAGGDAS